MSAFDVIMASSKRKAEEMDDGGGEKKTVIGIGYEAKLCGGGVDADDPLYGTCYYGIAVRHGYASPDQILARRRQEHLNISVLDPKDIGVRAVIARYGPRALVWRIVVSKTNEGKIQTQEWANAWEKQAIADAGGMLRDMEPDRPIRQTFNLTSGGQGDARIQWQHIEARCIARWKRFQVAIEAFVNEYGTACVPKVYVCANGFKLGSCIIDVRQGSMLLGRSDEPSRRAYLENLPGWSWNENRAAWEKFKSALREYVDEYGTALVPRDYANEDGYKLGQKVHGVRQGILINGGCDTEKRRLHLECLPGWAWNAQDAKWIAFITALREYVRKTGYAWVPQTYVNPEGYLLGETVQRVRSHGHYWRGKDDEFERRQLLESLPGWQWKSALVEGRARASSELALLRATTHPNAKMKDLITLRNSNCVIRAHEVMRDRAVASALDTILDNVIERTA